MVPSSAPAQLRACGTNCGSAKMILSCFPGMARLSACRRDRVSHRQRALRICAARVVRDRARGHPGTAALALLEDFPMCGNTIVHVRPLRLKPLAACLRVWSNSTRTASSPTLSARRDSHSWQESVLEDSISDRRAHEPATADLRGIAAGVGRGKAQHGVCRVRRDRDRLAESSGGRSGANRHARIAHVAPRVAASEHMEGAVVAARAVVEVDLVGARKRVEPAGHGGADVR